MIIKPMPKLCKFLETGGCTVKGILCNAHQKLALKALECDNETSLWSYIIDLTASEDLTELQVINIESLEMIEIRYDKSVPMAKRLEDPLLNAKTIELTVYVTESRMVIEICGQLINNFIDCYNLVKLLVNVSKRTCNAKLKPRTPMSIEMVKTLRELQYKFVSEANAILILKPLPD